MTILEVKARHAGSAAKALPSGFLKARSIKIGIKRKHQCAFGVSELVRGMNLSV